MPDRHPRFLFALPALLAVVMLCLLASLAPTPEALAARRSDNKPTAEPAVPKPPKPEDFAGQIVLGGEAGAVLSFVLPEEAYFKIKRPDHRDICVFDANGSLAPFVIRTPKSESVLPRTLLDLKFFPWRPADAAASVPRAGDIEISSGGSIVRIKGAGASDGMAEGPVYLLVDMQEYLEKAKTNGHRDGSITALRKGSLFISQPGDRDFTSYVTMKTSNDLNSWRDVGARQVLVRAGHGGNVLSRDSISLPDSLQRYLLLKIDGDRLAPERLRAELEYSKSDTLTRKRVVNGVLSDDKRSITYDLGGFFAVNELSFKLKQNDIVNVTLYTRNYMAERWNHVARGIIYRLNKDGEVITNAPFRAGYVYRNWKLESKGDIVFAEVPELEAEWQPDEVIFMARGQGPWTLAFGSSNAVDVASTPLDSLASPLPAHVVQVKAVAGDGAPRPADQTGQAEADDKPYEKWILWGILVLGVAVLIGIALWLGRSMRKTRDNG